MDPSGPAQPPLNTAYDQPANPASQTSSEKQFSNSTSASLQRSNPTAETRTPNDIPVPSTHTGDGMPSSLGYGVRNSSGDAGDSMGGPVSDLEGEQMRAAGDGEIASAQDNKTGFGEQESLTAGLDRKRAEQNRLKPGSTGGEGSDRKVDVEGAVGGAGKGFVGAGSGSGNSGIRGS